MDSPRNAKKSPKTTSTATTTAINAVHCPSRRNIKFTAQSIPANEHEACEILKYMYVDPAVAEQLEAERRAMLQSRFPGHLPNSEERVATSMQHQQQRLEQNEGIEYREMLQRMRRQHVSSEQATTLPLTRCRLCLGRGFDRCKCPSEAVKMRACRAFVREQIIHGSGRNVRTDDGASTPPVCSDGSTRMKGRVL